MNAAVIAAAIGLRTSVMVPPQGLKRIDGYDKPKDSLITALTAANSQLSPHPDAIRGTILSYDI
jgi:hypothetical protein